MSKIFTQKDWTGNFLEDVKEFYDAKEKNVEITEYIYYHFLECRPSNPIRNGFLHLGPYLHSKKGETQYLAFQNLCDKYYYIGLLTRKQAQLLCN